MCGEQARSSAIIGGGIYRGTTAPEFYGKYVAGDWGSDNRDVYMVDVEPDALHWNSTYHEYQCLDCDESQGHLNHIVLAHNDDILLLFTNALLRLIPSAECGIDNGVNGTGNRRERNDKPQGFIEVPYHYRAFEEPREISSTGGVLDVTLSVTHSRHSAGEVDATSTGGVLEFNTRVYNGHFAGPTLRIKAGDTLKIRVQNMLDDIDTDYFNTWNKFTKAQLTGLHTHGLHVPAERNADNVFHEILPGESYDYEYPIHDEHAPGMSYYHSHIHGASYLQTMGGLYGALIVEIEPSPEVEALLNLTEFVTLVGVVNSQGLDKSTSFERLTTVSASSVPAALTHAFPDYQNYALVNGVFQPTVDMDSNTLYQFRVTNTAGENLLIYTAATCEMWVIAQDALYLQSPRKLDIVYLGPANRADILFLCSEPGLFPVHSNKSSAAHYLTGDVIEQTLLYLRVNPGESSITIEDINLPTLPKYLPDLQNFQEYPIYLADPITMDYGEVMNTDKLQSASDISEVWKVGRVYQTTITSTSFHPYHLHVNHFQIVDYSYHGGKPDLIMFKVGDRRDTVPTLAGMEITIRFFLHNYTGRALSHCHVSHHADLGMMRLQYIADDEDLGPEKSFRTKTMYMDVPDREFNKWITTYTSDDCTLDRTPCDLSEPTSVLTRDSMDTNGDPYYSWPLADGSYTYFVHQQGEARRETGAFMEVRGYGTFTINPGWTVPLNPDPLVSKTTYPYHQEIPFDEPNRLSGWKVLEFAFSDIVPNAFPMDRTNIISTNLVFRPQSSGSIMHLKTIGYYRDVALQDTILLVDDKVDDSNTLGVVVGLLFAASFAAALVYYVRRRKAETETHNLRAVISRRPQRYPPRRHRYPEL